MTFRLLVLAAVLFCVPLAAQAGVGAAEGRPEARFFSAMQDVPLVPGLTELKDQTVAFDKPEGRIVEAVAEIDSFPAQAIEKAYEETLPQLGWARTSARSYSRETETLSLNFESYDGRNFLRVLVRPLDRIPD